MSLRVRDIKNILVVDVEATMGFPKKEIVEIGIAIYKCDTKEIEKCPSIYVKPKFSRVTSELTKLTGITQELLDEEGVSYKKACNILQQDYLSKRRIWMSWGDDDKMFFDNMDSYYKLKTVPFSRCNYLDLSMLYSSFYGIQKRTGLLNTLERHDFKFEGRQHRACDDAYNTAKLTRMIWSKINFNYFSFTEE